MMTWTELGRRGFRGRSALRRYWDILRLAARGQHVQNIGHERYALSIIDAHPLEIRAGSVPGVQYAEHYGYRALE